MADFGLEAFRQRLFTCMRMIYPQGPSSAYQHRDVIRCFSMGWAEALIAANCREGLAQWTEEWKLCAEENWWPGPEWAWWQVEKRNPYG